MRDFMLLQFEKSSGSNGMQQNCYAMITFRNLQRKLLATWIYMSTRK